MSERRGVEEVAIGARTELLTRQGVGVGIVGGVVEDNGRARIVEQGERLRLHRQPHRPWR